MADLFSIQGKRILLCDQEGMIIQMLALQLQRVGMRIIGRARTGEEAVTMALQERPDFALIGLHLPDFDGLETARQILGVYSPCILLMTGGAEEDTDRRAEEIGISSILLKPFFGLELPARLEAAFDKHQQQQR